MRPLRLELEGFLSYREPTTVELSGLGAAVILGPNGAGKTSIVEAMGWALFGKGRGRSPDDFVSAGATSCRVVFEFELSGVHYRVERQREIGKASKSYLGLFAHREEGHYGEEPWYPIGGDHISETQTEIERVLGMSFETWMATSFIGQGRADEFTRRRPAERKDLLGEVLELGTYAALAEAAKARGLQLVGDEVAIAEAARRAQELVDQEAPAREQHAAALERRREAERAVEAARTTLASARRHLEEASDAAAAAERTGQRLEEMRAARMSARERTVEELDRAEQEADRVAGEIRQRRTILGKLRASASLLDDLRAQTEQEQARVRELEAAREAAASEAAALEAELARLEERSARSERERAEAAERRELLARDEASCYVCRQALDAERRAELLAALDEGALRLAEERKVAERERMTVHVAIETGRGAAGATLSELRRAREVHTRTVTAAEKAAVDQARIGEEERYLADARARLDAAASLADRLREERDAYAEPGADEQDLLARMPDVREVNARLQLAQDDAAQADEAERGTRDALTSAAEAVGRADGRLEEIARARTELQALEGRRQDLQRGQHIFAVLAEAFGRDGIPTLVVENALPELEQEANRLLERLSDARLSVQIESLRATKGGGLRETLDIRVADETDERPLEDLSGGERQCVDLALRVGLSRLLARRAGRPMETLILDEAFTALDAGRRQRAIEVIHALSEEFGTVLFITHLAEMADAFPIRFEVTKNGTSKVEVLTA